MEGTSSKTMNEMSKGTLVGVLGAGPLMHPRTWHQLWLDRQRETMVMSLQGHAMAIADRLVREGDMDPSLDEAYQLIVSQHTVPVQRARCLIDFLRRKPPETFDHFQSALDELGCGELLASNEDVRELEVELNSLHAFERLSSCFPASVERARELLKASFLKAAESIHVLEGISRNKEGGSKDLDEIFVNIGLVSSDEVERLCSEWTGKDGGVEAVLANALAACQVSLCDLWRARQGGKKEPDKILALGTAGSGKTLAFTTKASYEWCGGKFWEQMALLRTIRCRDKSVWRAGTVSKLFRLRELGLSAAEEKDVETFIIEHPGRVVLVCDGLDEGGVDNKDTFLWRVLSGESLPGLRIIVTSRPCAAVTDLSQDGAIDRHLQLFGFNTESMQAFAVKCLGEEEGRRMLSQLSKNSSISSLMRTPFFALLICEEFKEGGQLPQRRSDIFSRVTLRVVQRFAKRLLLKTSFKSVEKAPGQLFEKVLEVGKVAFDRLKKKDLSYFELEEEDLSAEAVGLGFLEHVQSTISSEEDRYGFRHLTVQEYLAAVYVCREVLKNAEDVVRLAQELGCGEESGHLNTFWVFVASLVDSSLREELFCAIAETDMQTVTGSVEASERAGGSGSAAQPQAGTEGDCEDAEREETRAGSQKDQQPDIQHLGRYRFLLLLHCYAEAAVGSARKPSACVGFVLNRQGVTCRGYRGLSHSDLSVLSRVMECHSDIVEKVDMDGCNLGDDGVQQLLSGLLSCTNLKVLDLSLNRLSEGHMASVGEVVGRNGQSLEEVNVGWNPDVGDEGLHHLGDGLLRVQRLQRLHLSDLGLTQHSERLLANILGRQSGLVECSLSYNNIGDSAFIEVGPALQKCEQLEVLNLQRTDLDIDQYGVLASTLACLPRLRELDVSENNIAKTGFKQLAPGLQQCRQLRSLNLHSCGLRDHHGELMPLLALVLLSFPQLEKFSLSDNQIGNAGLEQLFVRLEECHRLTHLGLYDVGLTSSQSMSSVSRLLQRLNKLKVLNIHDNPYHGSAIADMQLCAAMEGHPTLEYLYLPRGMSRDAIDRLRHLQNDPACMLRKVEFF